MENDSSFIILEKRRLILGLIQEKQLAEQNSDSERICRIGEQLEHEFRAVEAEIASLKQQVGIKNLLTGIPPSREQREKRLQNHFQEMEALAKGIKRGKSPRMPRLMARLEDLKTRIIPRDIRSLDL